MRYIEKFEENARQYPDKVVLRNDSAQFTLSQVDDLSARVYAWLRSKGVGHGDVVFAALPHQVESFIFMIGVWKAGAAFTVCSDEMPDERKAFIRKDCRCKLTVTTETWSEIRAMAPLAGHEDTDAHELAFIVYTSGSEGTPKGVMQEYGKLDIMPESLASICMYDFSDTDRMFLFLPVSTVGAVVICLWATYHHVMTDVGSMQMMKDPRRLQQYIIEERFTILFLTPSYYKASQITSPYVNAIYLSSEIVSGIRPAACPIRNLYDQSEGYHLACFELDREYTTTPIGKPIDSTTFAILDDDGEPVADGMTGEFCYVNPYFRGYVNDEARTEASFVNSYFRSGDIARKDKDGNYVILGRKSDMIKINGNRIEPAEIEAAVKRVLGVERVIARGFVQENGSFICVYYTDPIEVDMTAVREALMTILPPFMMPSYFVRLDKFPLLPNGKINRRALQAPDAEQYRTAYAAPGNEVEARLCTQMEQILGIGSIGIDDDFFFLGGDSLRAIRLATECNIPGLNVTDIYTARTPRAIAERWMLRQME